MLFEWDESKNRANIRKHGVSFDTARRVFGGPVLSRVDDRVHYGEVRHVSIGRVGNAGVLVVAHTERDGRVRLISARPASRKERQAYYERIR